MKVNVPIVFNQDGTKGDIQKLQVGQNIVVKFTGAIEESIPAKIKGITEIRIE